MRLCAGTRGQGHRAARGGKGSSGPCCSQALVFATSWWNAQEAGVYMKDREQVSAGGRGGAIGDSRRGRWSLAARCRHDPASCSLLLISSASSLTQPIWVNLTKGRLELYRDIRRIYYGHSPFLEEQLGSQVRAARCKRRTRFLFVFDGLLRALLLTGTLLGAPLHLLARREAIDRHLRGILEPSAGFPWRSALRAHP